MWNKIAKTAQNQPIGRNGTGNFHLRFYVRMFVLSKRFGVLTSSGKRSALIGEKADLRIGFL
jgi:hypothetical protein